MKNVAITGGSRVELVDVPDPQAQGEFVVVKIEAAPMCTEFKFFKQGRVLQWMGHEAAGEVVEVAQPGNVKVGDRVIVQPQFPCGKCNLCRDGDYIHCQNNYDMPKVTGSEYGMGTFAQYILKQDWLLIPIDDDMSYDHAGMAICGLGPAFGAMQLMQVDSFDTVLITGMGPVGLGGVINGVFRGARVLAVEGNPYRAKLAKELGAEAVINPGDKDALEQIMDLTKGLGVDKAVECAGVSEAQRLVIDASRRKGQVAFVALGGGVTLNTWTDMITKGLTLHGAWHYNIGDMGKIMQVIRKSGALLDKQITHRFAIGQVQEAFELQISGNCGKTILYPWQ